MNTVDSHGAGEVRVDGRFLVRGAGEVVRDAAGGAFPADCGGVARGASYGRDATGRWTETAQTHGEWIPLGRERRRDIWTKLAYKGQNAGKLGSKMVMLETPHPGPPSPDAKGMVTPLAESCAYVWQILLLPEGE